LKLKIAYLFQPPFGLHPFDPRLPFSSAGAFRPLFGNSAAAAAAAAAAVAVSVANSNNDSNNSRYDQNSQFFFHSKYI
jgi:hypothetical protein